MYIVYTKYCQCLPTPHMPVLHGHGRAWHGLYRMGTEEWVHGLTSSTTLCMRSTSLKYCSTCWSSRKRCSTAVEAWQACATMAPTGHLWTLSRSPLRAMYCTSCEAPCLAAMLEGGRERERGREGGREGRMLFIHAIPEKYPRHITCVYTRVHLQNRRTGMEIRRKRSLDFVNGGWGCFWLWFHTKGHITRMPEVLSSKSVGRDGVL